MLSLLCALALVTSCSAWGAESCGSQSAAFKASQRKLNLSELLIEKTNTRLASARTKVTSASESAKTLVAKAELKAKNSGELLAAMKAACQADVVVNGAVRKPDAVTYSGRRYKCTLEALTALTRASNVAAGSVAGAKKRAQSLQESAQTAVRRMQERIGAYQQKQELLLVAHNKNKTELDACRGVKQPEPGPASNGSGSNSSGTSGVGVRPSAAPLTPLGSHIRSSFYNLTRDKRERNLISNYVEPLQWTRNINSWARSIDLTGTAVAIQNLGGVGGGTLITKKHVFLSNHVPYPELPAKIYFVDNQNNSYEYKIVKVKQVGTTDMKIGELDREVDPSLKVYEVLPSNYRNWLPGGFQVLYSDYEKKAHIGEIINLYKLPEGMGCEVGESSDSALSNYFEPLIVGDSGNPVFTMINNQPVLIGGWWRLWGARTAAATFIPDALVAINETIASLSAGYQASPAALGMFEQGQSS